MTDQAFERRLARDLVALASDEIAPFDVQRIAEQAIGTRHPRVAIPGLRLTGRRWALPLMLALLAAAIAAGLIASQVLRTAHDDAYHAVLVRAAGDPVGDYDSTAIDVVLADADGNQRVVRHLRAQDLAPGARSIQSGGSASVDGWLALFPGEQVRLGPDAALTWAVAFIDLTDPAKPPIVVGNHSAMGPRFGPDGLVGIPAGTGGVRLLDLDTPDAPERLISGVAFVGGGPEIVWAADGSGFLAESPSGVWGVRPIDGGAFRPGFPRVLSRWMSPDVPGYWLDSGEETPNGHWLYGGGLSAGGDAIWTMEEDPAGAVLSVSRASLDGSEPTTLRRIPADLARGGVDGLTLVGLDLAPDDSVAAIRVDQADTSTDHAILLRTDEQDADLPGARVDGRLVGWIADAVERRITPYPPELVLEATGAMAGARSGHAAVALPDGRVLVTGGWDGWPQPGEGLDCGVGCDRMNHIVELYDPTSASFTALPEQKVVTRQRHSATVLADGRVLLTGGQDAAGNVLGASELFDPTSGTFSTAASLHVPREGHVAVTLQDGRIVLLGGIVDASGAPTTPVPETYDPVTDTWTQGPANDLLADAAAAVALPGGDVMVLSSVVSVFPDAVDSRGLASYDPAAGTVRAGRMIQGNDLGGALFGRIRGATLAPDGRVVFALRDERNAQAWAGDDSGVYALQTTIGVVTLVARGIGRPVLGPVSITDGRMVVLTDDPAGCGPVTAWVVDATTGDATSLGEVPAIGTCNGLPGSTLTALPGDRLLIAGGNTGGGETTPAASLIHPGGPRS